MRSRPDSRVSGCGPFHRGDPVRDFLGRRSTNDGEQSDQPADHHRGQHRIDEKCVGNRFDGGGVPLINRLISDEIEQRLCDTSQQDMPMLKTITADAAIVNVSIQTCVGFSQCFSSLRRACETS